MNLLNTILRNPIRAVSAGILLCAAPTAIIAPATPLAAQSKANRLDEAVVALRDITTLQADFIQSDRNGQRVKGVLTIKRPGKIRFEYEKAANMLIVGNGSSLTLIDYDVQQVQRWPIGNSPLGALLDPKRDVKRYGTLRPTSSPNVLSVQVRDPNKPEYGTITLILNRNASAPGGWQLSSWVALDAQNQRTTVMLSGHRYGMSVSDSAFTYRDPRRTTRRPR